MPSIRSSALERRALLIKTIVLLSKIMPLCSRCVKKKLLCVIIAALSSH